ncbi:two-component system QseEF-associated lipoprotein QseG [Enterobacteriaceae bacterium H11S18]|uniref:two-component system QseEF-associated lipoprotein QseG n=1 Tax=Dryocola clanedunensis TaxID=2925396 RepID=UPI0022F0746F|nr:two-component system QseEF-associated lipoprotein QseG [Dryocola clanedunensis]MCT4707210.1 two-component system QseEF-associated lipoprotein QseG [Dryocola clanedunensis]MCT4712721.1 two-component system QseEF-associated lipoprotein QseG [Dryocola clanedunensis]
MKVTNFRRRVGVMLLPLLLAGCVQNAVTSLVKQPHQPQEPEQQLADYLSTDCMEIWHIQAHESLNNPLFWLRGMDCAERLPPAEARAEARRWQAQNWQDTFKRGILLANAKITPTERRRYMTKLDAMTGEVPPQVRPLFQVWRDGQASLLDLSDERSRYSKLQQSTDGELDTLREQQQRLRSQLDLTTRKLENLTDIERQLSSRKPSGSYLPENPKGADKSAPASAAQGDADDEIAKPAPAKDAEKPEQEAKP